MSLKPMQVFDFVLVFVSRFLKYFMLNQILSDSCNSNFQNFFFKALQKVRLLPSADCVSSQNGSNWLTASSSLRIGEFLFNNTFLLHNNLLSTKFRFVLGVAVNLGKSFVSFSTEDVQNLKVNKQNINEEYSGLTQKSVALHREVIFRLSVFFNFSVSNVKRYYIQGSIVSIQSNCDGSLLGALVNTTNGPFVFVYDMRVFSPAFTSEV